jgi:outer membrane protein TolC
MIETFIAKLADLRAAEEKLSITRQFTSTLSMFAGIARVRYSAGKSSLVDVSLSRSLAADYLEKSAELDAVVKQIHFEIDYYLVTNESESSQQKDQNDYRKLSQGLDPYLSKMNSSEAVNIQDLPAVQFEAAIREASESRELASKLQYLPDMGVFVAAGRNNIQMLSGRGSENSVRAGLQFKVPLWSGLSNHKQVAAEKNQNKAEDENVRDTFYKLQKDLSVLDEQIRAGEKRLLILAGNSLPNALTAYRSSIDAYRAGTVDISSAISSFDAYYSVSMKKADLNAQLRKWKATRLALINRILPEVSNEPQK